MQAVDMFSIADNSFTGVLPESGLSLALREVTDFSIDKNRFAGALALLDCREQLHGNISREFSWGAHRPFDVHAD
eukprot:1097317-Amphidinium_carterae.1